MSARRHWIKLVVIEPFPVLFGHTSITQQQIDSGPKYAPGMTTYDVPDNRSFREWQAQGLRDRGYK